MRLLKTSKPLPIHYLLFFLFLPNLILNAAVVDLGVTQTSKVVYQGIPNSLRPYLNIDIGNLPILLRRVQQRSKLKQRVGEDASLSQFTLDFDTPFTLDGESLDAAIQEMIRAVYFYFKRIEDEGLEDLPKILDIKMVNTFRGTIERAIMERDIEINLPLSTGVLVAIRGNFSKENPYYQYTKELFLLAHLTYQINKNNFESDRLGFIEKQAKNENARRRAQVRKSQIDKENVALRGIQAFVKKKIDHTSKLVKISVLEKEEFLERFSLISEVDDALDSLMERFERGRQLIEQLNPLLIQRERDLLERDEALAREEMKLILDRERAINEEVIPREVLKRAEIETAWKESRADLERESREDFERESRADLERQALRRTMEAEEAVARRDIQSAFIEGHPGFGLAQTQEAEARAAIMEEEAAGVSRLGRMSLELAELNEMNERAGILELECRAFTESAIYEQNLRRLRSIIEAKNSMSISFNYLLSKRELNPHLERTEAIRENHKVLASSASAGDKAKALRNLLTIYNEKSKMISNMLANNNMEARADFKVQQDLPDYHNDIISPQMEAKILNELLRNDEALTLYLLEHNLGLKGEAAIDEYEMMVKGEKPLGFENKDAFHRAVKAIRESSDIHLQVRDTPYFYDDSFLIFLTGSSTEFYSATPGKIDRLLRGADEKLHEIAFHGGSDYDFQIVTEGDREQLKIDQDYIFSPQSAPLRSNPHLKTTYFIGKTAEFFPQFSRAMQDIDEVRGRESKPILRQPISLRPAHRQSWGLGDYLIHYRERTQAWVKRNGLDAFPHKVALPDTNAVIRPSRAKRARRGRGF